MLWLGAEVSTQNTVWQLREDTRGFCSSSLSMKCTPVYRQLLSKCIWSSREVKFWLQRMYKSLQMYQVSSRVRNKKYQEWGMKVEKEFLIFCLNLYNSAGFNLTKLCFGLAFSFEGLWRFWVFGVGFFFFNSIKFLTLD